MEHSEAVETKAVERYLLKEMNEAERDAFEAHYFDCPTCAEDVRQAQVFAADIRVVFQAEDRNRQRNTRAALAGFLLGLGVGICLAAESRD